MRTIGLSQGQIGDLFMNIVACRSFKERFPESIMTLGINRKYSDVAPLFQDNPLVNAIHIWEGYDDWPQPKDQRYLDRCKFDHVFNPMPQHTRDDWYLHRHQTEEVCLMHGLTPPNDLSVSLTQWFKPLAKNPKYVVVNLSAATRAEAKTPSPQKAKEIVQTIIDLGFIPVQIGLASEPKYCEQRFIGSWLETVKFVLSCKFLITVDSAIAWIASGYQFPTIGLYAFSYYPDAKSSANWQPKNTNLLALESPTIGEITIESVSRSIISM